MDRASIALHRYSVGVFQRVVLVPHHHARCGFSSGNGKGRAIVEIEFQRGILLPNGFDRAAVDALLLAPDVFTVIVEPSSNVIVSRSLALDVPVMARPFSMLVSL